MADKRHRRGRPSARDVNPTDDQVIDRLMLIDAAATLMPDGLVLVTLRYPDLDGLNVATGLMRPDDAARFAREILETARRSVL